MSHTLCWIVIAVMITLCSLMAWLTRTPRPPQKRGGFLPNVTDQERNEVLKKIIDV